MKLIEILMAILMAFQPQDAALTQEPVVCEVQETQQQEEPEELYMNGRSLSDDIDYLAQCIMAESENQCELGKRLVCDTILNRVASDDYPDTIFEVINQPGQFEVVANGRIYDMPIDEDIVKMIGEELRCQYNTEVLYFRIDHFHTVGTPYMLVQDVYFSTK